MSEFFDESGNKVEAYTAEEIAQKLEEERLEAIEETNVARQDEIDVLNQTLEEKEKALTEAQEYLVKEKDKDKNLGGQRKVIESKENEIGDLKKEIEQIKQDSQLRLTEIEQKTKENTINSFLDKISDGNKELKEKIKFHYDNFKGEPKNEEEMTERVKNAYILATGGQPAIKLTGEVISGAGGAPEANVNIPEGKINPEAVPLAHKMGVTDQDLKKHKLI